MCFSRIQYVRPISYEDFYINFVRYYFAPTLLKLSFMLRWNFACSLTSQCDLVRLLTGKALSPSALPL